MARSAPAPVAGGVAFTSTTAGNHFTCGLDAGGTAYCWGNNANGQLGDGTTIDRLVPTHVAGALKFKWISGELWHTCAAATAAYADAVYCWGQNDRRQLGAPSSGSCASSPCSTTPILLVMNGKRFKATAAGGMHSCALNFADRVWCWGENASGQLGDSSNTSRPTPVKVKTTL